MVIINKLTSVFHASQCPVIDDEFRQNTASGSADYFDNVMTKFIVNNRTDGSKPDINLFFTITSCQIVHSRSLLHRINYKFICLSAC